MTERSKHMDVKARVDLGVEAAEKHLAAMRSAASLLADNRESVRVSVLAENPKSMLAEFTILRAREIDVVDRVMRKFAMFMDDFADQTVWFPKKPRKRRPRRAHRDRTPHF